jgi:hypothetical protein
MILLGSPFDPGAARHPAPLRGQLVLIVSIVLTAVLAGSALGMLGRTLRDVGRGLQSAAIHGGLLAGGWVLAAGRPVWQGPVIPSAGALVLASLASRLSPWGAVLYALPPLVLVRAGLRWAPLRGMGLNMPVRLRHIASGVSAGTFLGAHLLVSASLTLGYAVRVERLEQYLGAVAYDVGANALTAEWLFRGVLFSRWWQKWDFWPAAGLSTALAVCRYLMDPALPPAIEVRAGTVFYTGLLGFSACWLRAESGSLFPGYLATVIFFAAYRMLAQ